MCCWQEPRLRPRGMQTESEQVEKGIARKWKSKPGQQYSPDKIDLKAKTVTGDKGRHYIMGSIQEEDVTIV